MTVSQTRQKLCKNKRIALLMILNPSVDGGFISSPLGKKLVNGWIKARRANETSYQSVGGAVPFDSGNNHCQYIARLHNRRTQRLRQERLDSNCISIDIYRYYVSYSSAILFGGAELQLIRLSHNLCKTKWRIRTKNHVRWRTREFYSILCPLRYFDTYWATVFSYLKISKIHYLLIECF